MSHESIILKSENDLKNWVSSHKALFEKDRVFLLKGSLGAGKTTLVSYVVESWGGRRKQVTSPTFALHHSYSTPRGVVDHLDLYRLETEYDFASSGLDEVLESEGNLAFIEWAERQPESSYRDLNKKVYWLELVLLGDETRSLNLKPL